MPDLTYRYGSNVATSNPDAALKSVEALLAADPSSAGLWSMKGDFLDQLQHPEEAVAAYAQCLALDPAALAVLRRQIVLLHRLSRFREVVSACEHEIRLDSNCVDAWHNRGTALLSLNRFSEALESFDRALALDPRSVPAWHGQGNALSSLGRHPEALESYERAIALDERSVHAWHGRGNALVSLGRHPEALESYERAIAIQPNDYLVRLNLAVLCQVHPGLDTDLPNRAKLELLRALHILCQETLPRGLNSAWQLIRDLSPGPLLLRRFILAHPAATTSLSYAYLVDQAFADCLLPDALLLELNSKLPNLPEPRRHFLHGLIHFHFGDSFTASDCFETALELDTTLLAAHHGLLITLDAGLYPRDEELAAAADAARQALAATPAPSPEQAYYAGLILQLAGDSLAALAALEAAAQFLPALYSRWFLLKDAQPAAADALLEQIFSAEAAFLKAGAAPRHGFIVAQDSATLCANPDKPGLWIPNLLQLAHFHELSPALATLSQDENLARIPAWKKLLRLDVPPQLHLDPYQNQLQCWSLHEAGQKKLLAQKRATTAKEAAQLEAKLAPHRNSQLILSPALPVEPQLGDFIHSADAAALGSIPVGDFIRWFHLTDQLTVEEAQILSTYLAFKTELLQRIKTPETVVRSVSIISSLLSILAGDSKLLCISLVFGTALNQFLSDQLKSLQQASLHELPRYEIFKADFYKYWNQYAR